MRMPTLPRVRPHMVQEIKCGVLARAVDGRAGRWHRGACAGIGLIDKTNKNHIQWNFKSEGLWGSEEDTLEREVASQKVCGLPPPSPDTLP
jgi:hypothetical protein